MVDAACARGEKALFFSLEESPGQLVRNMRSIGIDLQRWIDAGLLLVRSVRPTAFGFEEHLAMLHRLLDEHEPVAGRARRRRQPDPRRRAQRHHLGDLPRPRPAQGPRHHHA